MNMTERARVALSLLLLRVGVFVVFFAWTMDKFFKPDHAAKVFQKFYGIGGVGPVSLYLVAALELALILAFLAGFRKRLVYGLVLALHAVSTFSAFRQYLDPFGNLLFFAAWPMLAACFALYYLRDLDTLWTVDRNTRAR